MKSTCVTQHNIDLLTGTLEGGWCQDTCLFSQNMKPNCSSNKNKNKSILNNMCRNVFPSCEQQKKRIPIESIGWSQMQWTKLRTIRLGRLNLMRIDKMIAWSESHALKLEPTHKLKWAWWIPNDMVERMWGKEWWYNFFEMIYSPL